MIFFQTLLILSVFWRTGFSRSTAHSLAVTWRHFPADPHFRAAWLQHVQQLFKSLTKGTEYLLCLETVKNPKTLPCLHSFCLECLDELANVARKQLQTTINCLPFARLPFQLRDTDTVANWPSLFHLNQLMDVLALEKDTFQAQKCNTGDSVEQLRSMLLFCLPGSNYSKPD